MKFKPSLINKNIFDFLKKKKYYFRIKANFSSNVLQCGSLKHDAYVVIGLSKGTNETFCRIKSRKFNIESYFFHKNLLQLFLAVEYWPKTNANKYCLCCFLFRFQKFRFDS